MREAVKKEVQIIRPLSEYADKAGVQRVAAYCRVSSNSDDQVDSFINQVKYYTDFIRTSEQMELVDIYADEGITGTSINKREEFKRMMNDARLGKIDRIYVKSIQRFARNSLECLEAIRKLKEYGVSVYFENDRIDTGNMNSEMILYIKSAFAQNDSAAFSKRMKTSYRMRMENGSFITCTPPYGYRLEKETLVIIPEEAEIVRKIFDMYLSGMGSGQITAALNREGLLYNGRKWNEAHIRYILLNEKYVGDSLLQKNYTPDEFPFQKRINRGQRDQFYIRDSHPAIIDREVYEAVKGRIKEREKYAPKNKGEKYLLTRMIFCGECGWVYKRKVQNGIVYWVCSQRGNYGYECGGKNLSESAILLSFVFMYNRLRQYEAVLVDSTLAKLCGARERLISESAEISQIDAEIAKLCSQNDIYVRLRTKNIMDEVSFEEQTSELQKRITTLRARRKKIMSEDKDTQYIEELRMLKEMLQNYPPAILTFNQEIFLDIVEKIEAGNDGTIAFILKGGLKLKERMGL